MAFNRSDDVVFNGLISGNGDLVKQARGSLTITADNTYQGNTAINGGTLILSRTGDFSLPGVISGSGALTYQGSGTWNINNSNTITGVVTIQSGTVAFPSGAGANRRGFRRTQAEDLLSVNNTGNLARSRHPLGRRHDEANRESDDQESVHRDGERRNVAISAVQLTYNSGISGPAGSTLTKLAPGACSSTSTSRTPETGTSSRQRHQRRHRRRKQHDLRHARHYGNV